MKFSLFILIFCLQASHVFGEEQAEIKKSDYYIDWNNRAGEYLIYDCKRLHYACVNKEGFENCQQERSLSLEKKESALSCAPLKKFTDKKSCVLESYKIVDRGQRLRFCYPKSLETH